MFKNIIKIILGTPLWVWFVFSYLLFIGFRARYNHIIYLPKLFIIPIIFIILKYPIFKSGNVELAWSYLLFILIGTLIGSAISNRTSIRVLKCIKSIEIPGNYQTLVILIALFSIKYIFGFFKAIDVEFEAKYLLFEIIASALFTGFFLGKALIYSYKFYKSPL